MLNLVDLPVPAAPQARVPAEGGPAQKTSRDRRASAESAFAYSHETLEVRIRSKDGDVLEVKRSVTLAAGYSRASFGCDRDACEGPRGGSAEALAGRPEEAGGPRPQEGEGGLRGAMEWVREVENELRRQQAALMETLLKGRDGERAEGTGFAMVGFVLVAEQGAPEEASEGEDALVPEYWNAENTSDRIVAFATSFASMHGDGEFAEKILKAVADGFEQAHALTGDLPGAAGRLNRDTKDLVFEKLEKWLEEREAGAYNLSAQPVEPQEAQALT
jgi:hypothetical protein